MYHDREELKDIKLVHEITEWYLDLTYEYEDKKGIYEIHIPRVILPISDNMMPFIDINRSRYHDPCIQMGVYKLPLAEAETKHGVEGKYPYTIKTLNEKCQEMTLEEVEKKLGYKIKLVTKKEEE